MKPAIRIGVIGDFNLANLTHVATNESIHHAAEALGRPFETTWLTTDEPAAYENFHGLFGSPGSPYHSFEGALACIRYARENQVPFIGTCGGFQHLAIEYGRSIVGFKDAAHAESDPYASCLFVIALACSLKGKTMEVILKPGSKAASAMKAAKSSEAYYCNFGLNPEYRQPLEAAGLVVSGTDQDGEVRIVELPAHPFYIGTLFVPQARSQPGKPHPLILEFCRQASLLA